MIVFGKDIKYMIYEAKVLSKVRGIVSSYDEVSELSDEQE